MHTYSFQPSGRYFVFEIATGRTIERDLARPRDAISAMSVHGLTFPDTAGTGWSSARVGDVLRDVARRNAARI